MVRRISFVDRAALCLVDQGGLNYVTMLLNLIRISAFNHTTATSRVVTESAAWLQAVCQDRCMTWQIFN